MMLEVMAYNSMLVVVVVVDIDESTIEHHEAFLKFLWFLSFLEFPISTRVEIEI